MEITEEKSEVHFSRIIKLMRDSELSSDTQRIHIDVEIKKFQNTINALSTDQDELSIWYRKIFTKVKSALEELQDFSNKESLTHDLNK